MSVTPRLTLPMIAPGQAQKELFHNEALQALDLLVAAVVEGPPLATPPGAAVLGTCYIIAAGASGAWVDRAGQLAAYTSGGWRFVAPFDGLAAHVRSSGETAVYRAGAWDLGTLVGSRLTIGGQQVVGARAAAIAAPAGGTTIDQEARTAIGAILAALRQHGLIAT